jgi:hypothetical protein
LDAVCDCDRLYAKVKHVCMYYVCAVCFLFKKNSCMKIGHDPCLSITCFFFLRRAVFRTVW